MYFWNDYLEPLKRAISQNEYPAGRKLSKSILLERQKNTVPKFNFVVGGVQKGGTSALHKYLRQDPYIQVSKKKQFNFSDNETIGWQTPDYKEYDSSPVTGKPSSVVGESTPKYIFWPACAERIKRYNPNMKLIFLFRHPVARAFSHWKMECRLGVETRSFSWAIREGRKRVNSTPNNDHSPFTYVERGFYGQQLEHVLQSFPRNQLLLLLSEDFVRDPNETIKQISEFLGVPVQEKRVKPMSVIGSLRNSTEPVLHATDAEYLQNLYNADLKFFQNISGLPIQSWFH